MDSERGILSWIIVGTLAGWVATMIAGITQEWLPHVGTSHEKSGVTAFPPLLPR
jgi:hypothetical protein